MSAEQNAEPDFDLAAAGLRADGSDLRVSIEVLAAKLEDSLPQQTRVQRRGGGLLGRSNKRVRTLQVDMGECSYELENSERGLSCSRERRVGGIAIKRERLDPGLWVSALADELREQAQRSTQARAALEKLLG